MEELQRSSLGPGLEHDSTLVARCSINGIEMREGEDKFVSGWEPTSYRTEILEKIKDEEVTRLALRSVTCKTATLCEFLDLLSSLQMKESGLESLSFL